MNKQTIAIRIINFLGDLHGFDHLNINQETAAIDLHTGMIVRPSAEFPDGERLAVAYASGAGRDRTVVYTHKLVNSCLLRHAQAEAAINGGSVKFYFEHIDDHFARKTGFGGTSA